MSNESMTLCRKEENENFTITTEKEQNEEVLLGEQVD